MRDFANRRQPPARVGSCAVAQRATGPRFLLTATRLLFCLSLSLALSGPAVAGDTAVEQYLPELQQIRGQKLLEYQRLSANNNLVIIVTIDGATKGANLFTVTVKEVLKVGQNSRKVDIEESLDVQCWMAQLEKGKTFLMPVYLWGQGNNPAQAQTQPIELNKDFKNDPRYKLFKFILADDADPAPAVWSQTAWELYQGLKPGDFQKDGRLSLIGFMTDKHPDRIDGKHAEWAKEADRLLHEELLGQADKLRALEQASADVQVEFERALLIVVTLYAQREGLNAADEAAKLLALTPLALRAIDPLLEKIDEAGRVGFEAKFLPILQKQLEAKRGDRQEIQALYLARVLKSTKSADAVKEALIADPKRSDAALLARTLVMMRGPDAWPVVQPVLEGWTTDEGYPQIWVKVDLIKQTVEHVGRPCFPVVVKALKRSPNIQNMVYQFFNGLPPDSKQEFGCVMLEAGVHSVLQFMLQIQGMPPTTTLEWVIRYAVGEVSMTESGDPNLRQNDQAQLANSSAMARQWLKQRLKVDVGTRAEFNDWYLGRLEELKLDVPAELAPQVAGWKAGLSSPSGEQRAKTEKELRELGEKALPVLLDLQHNATDLTTRQTARALLLQLPIAPQVFVFDN